jgi:hypothetical protein
MIEQTIQDITILYEDILNLIPDKKRYKSKCLNTLLTEFNQKLKFREMNLFILLLDLVQKLINEYFLEIEKNINLIEKLHEITKKFKKSIIKNIETNKKLNEGKILNDEFDKKTELLQIKYNNLQTDYDNLQMDYDNLQKEINNVKYCYISEGPYKNDSDSYLWLQLWFQSQERTNFKKQIERILDEDYKESIQKVILIENEITYEEYQEKITQ